ncbi:hypothetical protein [Phytohabitans suffuscus]|uniref:Uncharacterized protein n=1 Tax=Phytohabitans suffuscus TaxID=624315 RepID=A0A6F8YCZ1_9ACTN|nr:hypothetical protein [Phytohabitans suffuscus]BCB83927.1 hypothetical protein Psuf_012400 [Phytohabitans suffuscus]
MAHESRAVSVLLNPPGYLLSYLWNGLKQAQGTTPEISSAAGSAVLWMEGVGLERLAADFPFVEFPELQLAYERGDAKEFPVVDGS